MNDFDLESKIKSLRVPERDEAYWQAFPKRVLTDVCPETARLPTAAKSFAPCFWWGSRLAVASLMLGFCLWQSRMPKALSHVLRKDELAFRQSVQRFDRNLGRFMQDEHGLDKLIEDQP